MNSKYNVTIVGGGITGSVLALALSHLSKNEIEINIIESSSSFKLKKDIRSIALSYGNVISLSKLNIWSRIPYFAYPICNIDISSNNHIGRFKIFSKDYNILNLGYTLNIMKFKKFLINLIQRKCNIRIYSSTKINFLYRDQNTINLFLSNNKNINTKLLIIACGSYCANFIPNLDINYKIINYKQIAIVANIVTTIAHKKWAFEKFTSYGNIAILPKSKHYSSIIWCIPINCYNLNKIKKEIICKDVQKEFGWKLGKIKIIDDIQIHNLIFKLAYKHVYHRVALIGNTAQTLHPLLGQGLNLGIRDAITLSKIIIKSIRNNKDFGSYNILLNYQKNRRLDQEHTIIFINEIMNLFYNKSFLSNIFCNFGLLASSFISLPYVHKIIKKLIFS